MSFKNKIKQQSIDLTQHADQKEIVDQLQISNFSVEPKNITESQISDLNNNAPDSLLNSEIIDDDQNEQEEIDEKESLRQLSYKKKRKIDNILKMKASFDSSKKANKS